MNAAELTSQFRIAGIVEFAEGGFVYVVGLYLLKSVGQAIVKLSE